MKKLLFYSILLTEMVTKAQVIDSVRIIPANPTNVTTVKAVVYGYFNSLTSFMSMNTYTVSSNVFQVDVYRCQGPAMALDFTKDTATLGILPVGIYTVNATMYSAIQDMSGNCPMLTPTGAGNVTFTVTSGNAIEALNIEQIKVFYRWNDEAIHLYLPDHFKFNKLEIVDVTGAVKWQGQVQPGTSRIATGLPQGLYFINLYTTTQVITKKLPVSR